MIPTKTTHESRSVLCWPHLARLKSALVVAAVFSVAAFSTPEICAATKKLEVARIYFEYNASANDLGVHVFLDGEDWKALTIANPDGDIIFDVEGTGPYSYLGLTELFFEGAEPTLDDVPLDVLLTLFPEGNYPILGETVDEDKIMGKGKLSHAIPAAPETEAVLGPVDSLVISWDPVTDPPDGFPDKPIQIVGYQVIVESFQVTVPESVLSVTVPPEFVGALSSGEHEFEVLAIEAGGNQTISEGEFEKP